MKFNIEKKILLGFLIVFCIYGIIFYINFIQINNTKNLASSLKPHTDEIVLLNEFSEKADSLENEIDKFFLTTYYQHAEKANENIKNLLEINSKLEKLSDAHTIEEVKELKSNIEELNIIIPKITDKFYEDLEKDFRNREVTNKDIIEVYKRINKISELHEEYLIKNIGFVKTNINKQIGIMENTISKTILFSSIAIIIGILLSIIISKSISRPVKKLKEASKEVAEGNLDIKTNIQTKDEIGDLSMTFDSMIEILRTSSQELKEYSKNLEKKVQIRTKDLNKKVKELEKKDKQILKINNTLKKANQKLALLDKEKDEFISIAAHELKTPLTSIKGFAQLMSERKVIGDKKQLKHYLELVDKNTSRLYKLILDLVDSSRLSLGKLKIDTKEINPNKIIKEIKENMNPVIREKNIIPKYNIQKSLPLIIADPERLLQIMRNLIVNATHFTPAKGNIIISAKTKDNYVQFEIKDSGEGIPKEKQAHIFSRFYQADASLTRKVKGSGLGLSICKGLINLMKGKIWFESKIGKGTSFFFTIPIAEEK